MSDTCCSNSNPVVIQPCLICEPMHGVIADANEWAAPACEDNHELLLFNPTTKVLRMWGKTSNGTPGWTIVSDPNDFSHVPVETPCMAFQECV